MKSTFRCSALALVILVTGCAVHTGHLSRGLTDANCADPTPDGAAIATCAGGVSAQTRQTVATDRCAEVIRRGDSAHGAFSRTVQC